MEPLFHTITTGPKRTYAYVVQRTHTLEMFAVIVVRKRATRQRNDETATPRRRRR